MNGELHPMQAAFHEHHGLQCGFCTPGMIMTAVDMVNRLGNDIDEKTVRHELEGNLCRCTGYHNIVKAIRDGAARDGRVKGGGSDVRDHLSSRQGPCRSGEAFRRAARTPATSPAARR